MTERKNLVLNIGMLLIVQFSNYVAPLLIFPYLTRTLSLHEFGIVAIAFSVCSLAMIFTDFGFGLSGAYWVAKNRDNKEKVNRYLGAIYAIKLFLSIIVILILISYFILTGNSSLWSPLVITSIIFVIFFQSFQMVWFFQGIEKMKNITYTLVTSKLIYLITILSFVHQPDDSWRVIASLGFSALIASALILLRIYKEGYSIARPHFGLIKNAFINSFIFFMSRAAVGIYTSASTFIVGSFAGVQQAGLYSSAEKLYQAGQSLTSPLSQALFPYLTRSKDERTLFRFLIMALPILIFGVTGCIFFSKEILNVLYGSEYISATPILQVFLITSVFTFLSVNLGYPAFSIYNRLDLANRSVFIAAMLHVTALVTLYFTNNISALNVAYCVCVVEFLVMLMRLGMIYALRFKNGK